MYEINFDITAFFLQLIDGSDSTFHGIQNYTAASAFLYKVKCFLCNFAEVVIYVMDLFKSNFIVFRLFFW